MNNLTTEQIARVFAMYIGCDISYDHMDGPKEREGFGILEGVSLRDNGDNLVIADKHTKRLLSTANDESAQLLLKPLSAISDEDAIEVAKIVGFGGNGNLIKAVKDLLSGDEWLSRNVPCFKFLVAIQFLTQQGYAVPLFIAPGHPCNGMDAIALGLALDSSALSKVNPSK